MARRAEEHLRASGIADTAYFGPECEFFVFDEVHYELGPNRSHYSVDSAEGYWNSGTPGLGYTARPKEGYFPRCPPTCSTTSAARWCSRSSGSGSRVSSTTTRSPRGQCRRPPLPDAHPDGRPGDDLQVRRQERRPAARQERDVHAEADLRRQRLGMHTHQSLWKEGTPLMADKSGYAGLSQLARAYVGGLLAHAPALLAFCAPTTNSYRRLVPGYEAPVNLVYSQRNRSACIRIPMYRVAEGEAHRVPLLGRGLEPVPGVLGDADGGPRRDRARPRPAPRPTSTCSKRRTRRSHRCRAR